ncbi:MAG: hypothetical protein WCJ66_19435 [Verrucomicrobiota bacterium]
MTSSQLPIPLLASLLAATGLRAGIIPGSKSIGAPSPAATHDGIK